MLYALKGKQKNKLMNKEGLLCRVALVCVEPEEGSKKHQTFYRLQFKVAQIIEEARGRLTLSLRLGTCGS